MNLGIDESSVLYGLGALLGVAAILYFGREIILELSPTVKSGVLLLGSVMLLALGEYLDQDRARSPLAALSAASYISFLLYTVTKFQLSSGQVFLALALSSAVFLAAGYLRSGGRLSMESRDARRVLLVTAAVAVVVVVFDVAGPQPEYNLELRDSVEVAEGEEFTVGTFTARNSFLLSRDTDTPSFRGCLRPPGEGREIPLHFRPELEDPLPGGAERTVELTERAVQRPDTNVSLSGSYTLRNAGCPEEPEEMTIYVQMLDGEGGHPPLERRAVED